MDTDQNPDPPATSEVPPEIVINDGEGNQVSANVASSSSTSATAAAGFQTPNDEFTEAIQGLVKSRRALFDLLPTFGLSSRSPSPTGPVTPSPAPAPKYPPIPNYEKISRHWTPPVKPEEEKEREQEEPETEDKDEDASSKSSSPISSSEMDAARNLTNAREKSVKLSFKEVKDLLQQTKPDIDDLRIAYTGLKESYLRYDKAAQALFDIFTVKPEEVTEQDACRATHTQHRSAYYKLCKEVDAKLPGSSSKGPQPTGGAAGYAKYNLPRPSLIKFGGDLKEWLAF